MVLYIQQSGNFIQYDTSDILSLGIRCKELLDELMNIAEASEDGYERDWQAARLKVGGVDEVKAFAGNLHDTLIDEVSKEATHDPGKF